MDSEKEKRIFTISFNGKTVNLDPLIVDMRYERGIDRLNTNQDGVTYEVLMKYFSDSGTEEDEATGGIKVVNPLAMDFYIDAVERLYPLMCYMFKVKPATEDPEGGMTLSEAIENFAKFIEFKYTQKKSTDGSPISDPSTTDTPDSAPTT